MDQEPFDSEPRDEPSEQPTEVPNPDVQDAADSAPSAAQEPVSGAGECDSSSEGAPDAPEGSEEPDDEDDDQPDPELTAPRRRDRRMTVTKNLLVELTTLRRELLRVEQSEQFDKWMRVETRKADANRGFNEAIKGHKGRCVEIAGILEKGAELKPVVCVWMYDWANGVRRLERTDTLEVVETGRIPLDELERWQDSQEPTLFDEPDAEEPAPAEPFGHLKCNACGWTWEIERTLTRIPMGTRCPSCDSAAVSAFTPPVGTVEYEIELEEDEPACRVCGCTENSACEGGCAWTLDPEGGDLCTSCADRLAEEDPEFAEKYHAILQMLDVEPDEEVYIRKVKDTHIGSAEIPSSEKTRSDIDELSRIADEANRKEAA